MKARSFFYVCAALFLLALSYHLGARSATAQAPGNPVVAATGNGDTNQGPQFAVAASGDVYQWSGKRVRVSTSQRVSPRPAVFSGRGDRIVGTIIAVTSDSIAIRPEQDGAPEIKIAGNAVTRFEVSRGERSRWLEGMGLGVLGGLALGYAIGYKTLKYEGEPSAMGQILGAGIGAVLGGLIGAFQGSGYKIERWQELPVPSVGGE